jgi:uncharacterized protein (TIGR00730 family)
MPRTICVYCSSSDAVAPIFFAAATELGMLLGQRRCALVYGGVRVGLLGALAAAVHQHGGTVVGVIPEAIQAQGIAYDVADELVVTPDLRTRKALMADRAEAFVALPGGFGTLEELLEIITLKQLGLHTKPIVLLNIQGFYEPLIALFEHLYRERFARPEYRHLYHIAPDVADAFSYLDTYRPVPLPGKWF